MALPYFGQIASAYAPQMSSAAAPAAPSPFMGPPVARVGPATGADEDWRASIGRLQQEAAMARAADIDVQNNEPLNRERNAAMEEKAKFAEKVFTNRYVIDDTKKKFAASDPTPRVLTPLEQARISEGIARGLSPESAADFAAGKIPDKDLPKAAPVGGLPLAAAAPPSGATQPTPFADPQAVAEGSFVDSGAGAPAAPAPKPAGVGGGAGGAGGGSASASASQSQAEVAPGGGDFDSPYYTEAGAAGAAAGAHRQLEQIEGDRAAKQAEVDAKAMRDLDRMNAEYEVKSKAHMAHLEEMAKEVESGKIDPERWWHSQSTGQQVLYHIAAFIGGFGAGFSGQPNSAMEIINRKITNDIEAQREDLLNKHKNIENVHSLLAETYKRTHNMEEAMLLAKNVAVDQVAAQAKALGVGAQGTLADAESLHKIAVIDQWRQQENERRDEFLQTETMKLAIARMHAKKAGGTGAASEKEVEALEKRMDSKNIDGIDGALSRVEEIVKEKDPAGIGPIKQMAQNDTPVGTVVRWGLSQEGRDNQADIADLKVQLTKNLSKVSAGTVKTVTKFMDSNTVEGLRHAAQIIRTDLEKQREGIVQSYPEAVQYEYLRRQGRLPGQGTPAAPNTGSSVPMAPLTGGK